MALRRQGLSQRRKAVGFTQESLAEHLGVERSTVVRWEAGDTEPLPSIRPKVARALKVSVDQLAELLTGAETAGTARAFSAGSDDTETTIPLLLPEVRSAVLPGRTEVEDPIRPQAAGTAEALPPAGAVAPDTAGMLLVSRSRMPAVSAQPGDPVAADADLKAAIALCAVLSTLSRAGSEVPKPAQTETPQRPSLTAVPLDVEPADAQRCRARSRRFNRFAAAGIVALAFAAGAASAPFITSLSGPISPATAGTPAPSIPVAADPAPHPGNAGSTSAVPMAPAAPNGSVDDPVPPPAVAVPAPHPIRSDSRSKPRAAKPAPAQPRTPAIPAEIAAWSHKAALSAREQYRTHLRLGALPRP